jgi:hypothetical protein
VPIVRGEMASAAPEKARGTEAPVPALDASAVPAGAPAGSDDVPPATVAAVMPRLAGLSLRQALEALAPHGVRLEISGRGVVTSQQPAPGAPLPAGTVCRLHLAPTTGRPTPAAVTAASYQP